MMLSLLLCLLPALVSADVDEVLRRVNAAPVTSRHFMEGGRERILDGYDMILSPEQFQRLYKGVKGRNDATTAGNAWTNGVVPYTFRANDYTADEIKLIKEAMNTWENLTCVRFVEDATATNRLLINTGRGGGNQCTAALGMEGGEQGVNLAKVCLTKDTIEHELGHALGMIHEHQRPQRDGYVRINYYGIEARNVGWLAKYAQGSDDKKGVEYDYGSIMHYSGTSFNKNSETTIYTRDPNQQYRIGKGYGPSYLDAKFINLLYGCAAKCTRPRHCGTNCLLTHDCKCLCKEDVPTGPCEDNFDQCDHQVKAGECQKNAQSMYHWCRKSCGMCGDGVSPAPAPECVDDNLNCHKWLAAGKCTPQNAWIMDNCKKTCGVCGAPAVCVDDNLNCQTWQSLGKCIPEDAWIMDNCKKSCGVCTATAEPEVCRDEDPQCRTLAAQGNCNRDTEMMLKKCRRSCHFCPEDLGDDPTARPGCVDYDTVCQYMADQGWCKTMPQSMGTSCAQHCGTCGSEPTVPESCQDLDVHCWIWTASGLCGSGWMAYQCPRSCGKCPAPN